MQHLKVTLRDQNCKFLSSAGWHPVTTVFPLLPPNLTSSFLVQPFSQKYPNVKLMDLLISFSNPNSKLILKTLYHPLLLLFSMFPIILYPFLRESHSQNSF